MIHAIVHRAITVSCAAAAGTTARVTAAPRPAAGTSPATATGTSASAFVAPQDRANEEWNYSASAGEASRTECEFAEQKPPARARRN